MLLEPWFTPDQWHVGHISANLVERPNLKLVRLAIGMRRGRLSVNDMHHLVARPKTIEYFVERLVMGLFTRNEYLGAFRDAGLKVSFDKKGLTGRGLYLGSKSLG